MMDRKSVVKSAKRLYGHYLSWLERLIEPYVLKELARRRKARREAVEADIRHSLVRGNLSMQETGVESVEQVEAALQRLAKIANKKQNWFIHLFPSLRVWDARRKRRALAWGRPADAD